jgi:hypothetical protein
MVTAGNTPLALEIVDGIVVYIGYDKVSVLWTSDPPLYRRVGDNCMVGRLLYSDYAFNKTTRFGYY